VDLPNFANIRSILSEDRSLAVRIARVQKPCAAWPAWTRPAIWALGLIIGLLFVRAALFFLAEISRPALLLIDSPAGAVIAAAAILGYLFYRKRAHAEEISYAAGQLAQAIETGNFSVQREPPNVRVTAGAVEIVLTEISCWQIDDMIDFARLSCEAGAYPMQLLRHTPRRTIPDAESTAEARRLAPPQT
jgi:hypothetical protein